MPGASTAAEPKAFELITRLLGAGEIDTVYRDLYLQRAASLLTPLLSRADYTRLEEDKVTIDNVTRRNRAAIGRSDWRQVKELTDRIRTLRHLVEEKRALLELGEAVYDVTAVPIDPFSPGFQGLFGLAGHDLQKKQARIVEQLLRLEKDDPTWAAFYADRRTSFQNLSVPALEAAPAAERADPHQLQQEALHALDRGDLEQVERLATDMLAPPVPHVPLPTLQVGRAAQLDLALPFSAETVAAASKLGLSPAQLEANEGAHEYLSCCCVWHARFPGQPLTESDKHMQGCTCGHACPPAIPAALQESLDLLIVHPFTNSGGARYLPRFAAEHVLVEEFPEQHADSSPSALLSGLGLPQRCGLSRLEIEHALLHHGPRIVHDELQLDLHTFRLLCIPFDVYSRLGPVQGWGQLPQWTHFDGYQILKGGKLRALVGGHVRLGGVYDLCSISRTHERVGTIARFAVVRRERFIAV